MTVFFFVNSAKYFHFTCYILPGQQLAALRSVLDYEDKTPLVRNVRPAQPINFRDVSTLEAKLLYNLPTKSVIQLLCCYGG